MRKRKYQNNSCCDSPGKTMLEFRRGNCESDLRFSKSWLPIPENPQPFQHIMHGDLSATLCATMFKTDITTGECGCMIK